MFSFFTPSFGTFKIFTLNCSTTNLIDFMIIMYFSSVKGMGGQLSGSRRNRYNVPVWICGFFLFYKYLQLSWDVSKGECRWVCVCVCVSLKLEPQVLKSYTGLIFANTKTNKIVIVGKTHLYNTLRHKEFIKDLI